jgi:hypothetical protein
MPNEPVTIDLITEFLEDAVRNKKVLSPSIWLDAASKMNVLLGDEADRLYGLQQKVAQAKLKYLLDDPKRNVSAAKLWVETTDQYREVKKLEAKIHRVEEAIRIAKVQAKLKDAEMRGY